MKRKCGLMKNFSQKLNRFLEKGHNKLIAKILFAVIIGVLSVFALYYAYLLVSAKTNEILEGEVVVVTYLDRMFPNLVRFLIFALIDFAIILVVKPLYGFTSFFENFAAKSKIRKAEKAKEKEEKAIMKARMDAVRAERIAKRKAAKSK